MTETSFKLCSDHERALDELSRAYPPAIETSFTASKYLSAMAVEEAGESEQLLRCPACAIGNGSVENADWALSRAVRCALPPDEVPLDLVLRRADKAKDAEAGTAFFEWPDNPNAPSVKITLHMRDHRENPLPPLVLEAFFEGPARAGKYLRFVVKEIASGVWKLAPSVRIPGMVTAFVTIVRRF